MKSQYIKSLVILILLFIFSINIFAVSLPPKLQVLLLLKLLPYDRNFKNKISDDNHLNIGIVYNIADSVSVKSMNRIKQAFKKINVKIKGASIKIHIIPICEKKTLQSILLQKKIKVLYIADNMNYYIVDIKKLCQKLKILSVTGYEVEKSVRRGITIGLGIKNRRPKIYVNLKSAIKEGCDFSSQFLALAEIVK